jgi:protein-S-isoprenylcysteine O-methyltransferase Ste14
MTSDGTRITLASLKMTAICLVVLCVSAGTPRYWQAWLSCGVQLAWMFVTNAYLMNHDPALLRRRLVIEESGEKEPIQRRVMLQNRLLALALLVVAGLDRRFGWSVVPPLVSILACAAISAGSALVYFVFRANTFTSSIVEIDQGQTVVSTGPYRFVRHPMYTGALLVGLALPPSLGSYWAWLFLPPSIALLVVRIVAEERFLADKLDGYRDYLASTKRRLVPGVW